MLAKIPLGKFAEVENVTQCIAYLLSDKSDMIHGAMIPIDGGERLLKEHGLSTHDLTSSLCT